MRQPGKALAACVCYLLSSAVEIAAQDCDSLTITGGVSPGSYTSNTGVEFDGKAAYGQVEGGEVVAILRFLEGSAGRRRKLSEEATGIDGLDYIDGSVVHEAFERQRAVRGKQAVRRELAACASGFWMNLSGTGATSSAAELAYPLFIASDCAEHPTEITSDWLLLACRTCELEDPSTPIAIECAASSGVSTSSSATTSAPGTSGSSPQSSSAISTGNSNSGSTQTSSASTTNSRDLPDSSTSSTPSDGETTDRPTDDKTTDGDTTAYTTDDETTDGSDDAGDDATDRASASSSASPPSPTPSPTVDEGATTATDADRSSSATDVYDCTEITVTGGGFPGEYAFFTEIEGRSFYGDPSAGIGFFETSDLSRRGLLAGESGAQENEEREKRGGPLRLGLSSASRLREFADTLAYCDSGMWYMTELPNASPATYPIYVMPDCAEHVLESTETWLVIESEGDSPVPASPQPVLECTSTGGNTSTSSISTSSLTQDEQPVSTPSPTAASDTRPEQGGTATTTPSTAAPGAALGGTGTSSAASARGSGMLGAAMALVAAYVAVVFL